MALKYADTLDERERRRARIMAYASAWFGCVSEVMMDSSAVLIIFMSMMHGSDFMSMMTTTVSGICSIFLMIPCAVIIPLLGLKKSVKYACFVGCGGFLLMAFAPLFGENLAKYVVLLGAFLFAIQRPLYSGCWYPLLDNFLRPHDRGDFFGVLRFSYMLICGGIMFALGLAIGKNPPVWLLQVSIALTGLLVIGRWYFINKLPVDPNITSEKMDWRKAISISLTNGPLTGYMVYLCLTNLAYTVIFPLTLIYLKTYVQLSPGNIQLISTIGIAGSVFGFFRYGKMLRKTSLRTMELIAHFAFIVISFALFFYGKEMPGFIYVISVLVFCLMFFNSIFFCNNSGEMMALARPGNKVMATAFCQVYGSFGTAVGRIASSLLIGSAILVPAWTTESGMVFSSFQTVFLFCGFILIVLLVLLPVMPSVVPKHHDYYDPPKK